MIKNGGPRGVPYKMIKNGGPRGVPYKMIKNEGRALLNPIPYENDQKWGS